MQLYESREHQKRDPKCNLLGTYISIKKVHLPELCHSKIIGYNFEVCLYSNSNSDITVNPSAVITGDAMGSWELHNIDLNISQKARVVFEGVRGKSPSKGGFSLDDINLSSMKCPQHIWHIRNITKLMATTPAGRKTYSPRFVSPGGYSFQVSVF